jgi:hypothetical protein
MLNRSLSVALAALALTFFLSQAARADEKTHEGKIVKAGDGKLTMTGKDGKKEHTHNVANNAKITCDGKECKLEDLKAGCSVKVTTKPDEKDKIVAIKIEAQSAAEKK